LIVPDRLLNDETVDKVGEPADLIEHDPEVSELLSGCAVALGGGEPLGARSGNCGRKESTS
jgi:hypothetical protein